MEMAFKDQDKTQVTIICIWGSIMLQLLFLCLLLYNINIQKILQCLGAIQANMLQILIPSYSTFFGQNR